MNSAVIRFLSATAFAMLLFAGCTPEQVADKNETGLLSTSEETSATETSNNESISITPKTTSMNDKTDLQLAPPAAGDKVATIETDFGTIKVRLFDQQVPEMTKNFEELANSGKYNGAPFHRVMKDFMIQTGDFTNQNGTGGHSYKGPGQELPDEIVPDLKHLYGTVSMANRGPNTNGSQFFIVTNKQGTSFLNGSYTVFGQVYEGMEVVHKIEALQIPGTEKPSETVTMTEVTVEPYKS